jgi:SAM-dependent methyltransferase
VPRLLFDRENLVDRDREAWLPPAHAPPGGLFRRALAAARRFVDLQAGSIWSDLRCALRDAEGPVVDVGCGAGPYRRLLPPGVEYVGIDIEETKERFQYHVPGVTYFRGPAWPVPDGAAGLVLASEVLEHVPEPPGFLAEAFRCLRPGGRLVLTVPFAARWHFVPHDYWRFTPSALKRLLEDEGFVEVRVYARGNALTVACYKVMALFLCLLFARRRGLLARLASRALGLAALPLVVALAAIGGLSMAWTLGGDDCLGYTAIARRPGKPDAAPRDSDQR